MSTVLCSALYTARDRAARDGRTRKNGMALSNWIDKLFAGGLGRLEAQNAAQQVEPLALPAEISIAGELVTVRGVEMEDRDGRLAFARSLPEYDLVFLPGDITQAGGVDEWRSATAAGRY